MKKSALFLCLLAGVTACVTPSKVAEDTNISTLSKLGIKTTGLTRYSVAIEEPSDVSPLIKAIMVYDQYVDSDTNPTQMIFAYTGLLNGSCNKIKYKNQIAGQIVDCYTVAKLPENIFGAYILNDGKNTPVDPAALTGGMFVELKATVSGEKIFNNATGVLSDWINVGIITTTNWIKFVSNNMIVVELDSLTRGVARLHDNPASLANYSILTKK